MTTQNSPVMGLKNTEIARLKQEITEKIAHLREIADEPVDIPYGLFVSFEVRPIAEGDRLNVYRDAWGCTSVNYTGEGLILDVCSEFELNPIHTASIFAEDLEDPDAFEASQATGIGGGEQGASTSQRELLSRLPAVAPGDLLERLTPVDASLGVDFHKIVTHLCRPYMAISTEQFNAILLFCPNSDVVEFDGIQMTFGSADGGYALMALSNRIPAEGLDAENAKVPAPGG